MRRLLAGALLLGGVLASAGGLPAATSPDEVLADPALEARARALGKELRCLVCQNQSIDDSDADLARDLRRIVREQLVAGRSDEEILRFLTARYGEFVLLEPPVTPATLGLWLGPLAVFLVAGGSMLLYLRRRQSAPPPDDDLDDAERARLEALLEDGRRS